VSFEVARGEIFGFLGPSGAGKSTTQKALTGLLRGFGGHVRVAGTDVAACGSELYERIGIAFEVPHLFGKLTAGENLRFFARLYDGPTEDPRRLLAAVGLDDAADERVERLSKGMRGRLEVARALIHRPQIVFLDEPTSGLDPGYAALIKDLIRERREAGTTVFLTTHNMTVADQLCDRVGFLVDGQLATVDDPQRLKIAHGTKTVRVEYGVDGGTAAREFPLDGVANRQEFLELMRSERVETIHSQEATLEDVFLRVTGRHLGGE
jgi:fluoroquinolone transport system ATP-binding protein